MERTPQNLQNHTKLDPAFHFFLSLGALLLLGAAIYNAVKTGFEGLAGFKAAVGIFAIIWAIVLMFKTRLYSLKVQDRVIRLEERLRLETLLPATLKSRIYELTEQQLIALRFASDAELPGLVEKTLKSNLDPKAIKQSIQTWRPDYWRV